MVLRQAQELDKESETATEPEDRNIAEPLHEQLQEPLLQALTDAYQLPRGSVTHLRSNCRRIRHSVHKLKHPI